MKRFCVMILTGLSLTACMGFPEHRTDRVTTAFAAPETTPLWRTLVSPEEVAHGHSGFTFLECGLGAYLVRLVLIEAATRTIDVQYYIWNLDTSGRAITEALLRAADRGVRVRALVDGFHIDARAEPLKRIARHPNVEVRIFNAFHTSFRSNFVRYPELVADFSRLNQRMHNKIIAVDNVAAVIGGRNVSDDYFGIDEERYFVDRDVVIVGPLAAHASERFDAFWSSRYAVPAQVFAANKMDEVRTEAIPAEMRADPSDVVLPLHLDDEERAIRLAQLRDDLVWASGSLSFTVPGPVFSGLVPPGTAEIESVFLSHLRVSRKEVFIQTPYMMLTVPRSEVLAEATARGVEIALHTNSLASTDSAIVHYGYARDRLRLLDHGVSLYEMKDRPRLCSGMVALGIEPRKAVLHPKTVVFDRRHVLIGSSNLDHRSILYNSEIGILIDSPVLAERILKATAEQTGPESSWRVEMEPPRRLIWIDESANPPHRMYEEPNTGFLAQLLAWIGYFLPIDHLL